MPAIKPARTILAASAAALLVTSAGVPAASAAPAHRRVLTCRQLEHIWIRYGGSPAHAVQAASVAKTESDGKWWATQHLPDGTVDRGLWQINSRNGKWSAYGDRRNTRGAILLSDDGTNWSGWAAGGSRRCAS